jgi:uncharacterized protein
MIAINVAQLLKEPPGASRKFDFAGEADEFAPEIELAKPVRGHADLLRTSRGILASSAYQTTVRQTCGRCLDPTTVEIEGSSSDEFMPKVDVVTGQLREEQAESEELVIDESHLLDLSEVIRQDILTRLPLQALCSTECPGLCPECGHDLRTGACACAREGETVSPFAGLADLLRGRGARDPSTD